MKYIHFGSDDGMDTSTSVAATATLVGGGSQTCSDFMEECKGLKDELVLFKQANQDLCSEVADLRRNVDSLSLC